MGRRVLRDLEWGMIGKYDQNVLYTYIKFSKISKKNFLKAERTGKESEKEEKMDLD